MRNKNLPEEEKKKKSIFDRAIDALTDRDEKEAAAEAEKRAEEAEKRARAAEERAREAEKEVQEVQREEGRRRMSEARRARREAPKKEEVKKHVVGPGDTLSGLAKQYYGKPAYKLWMHIYEANKEVIGDNPDVIRDGVELVIPDLTPELEKELED
jgi:nucleoid-associated protein YgaU